MIALDDVQLAMATHTGQYANNSYTHAPRSLQIL